MRNLKKLKKILMQSTIIGLLFLMTIEAYNQPSIPSGNGNLIVQSLLQTDGGKKLQGNYFATNYGKLFKIDTTNSTIIIDELVDFGEAINSTTFHKVGDTLVVHTYMGETWVFKEHTNESTKILSRKWFTSSSIITETNADISIFQKYNQITTTISKSVAGSILNEVKEAGASIWLSFTANGYNSLIEFDLEVGVWFIEGSYSYVYRSCLDLDEKYFYGSTSTQQKLLFIDSLGSSIERNITFAVTHIAKNIYNNSSNYGKVLMSTGSTIYSTDKIIEYDIVSNVIDTVFSFNMPIEFFYQVSDKQLLVATANDVFLVERDIISTTNNVLKPEVTIHPNPSTDWVIVTWTGSLSIFNNLGQLVLYVEEYDNEQLSVQHLPNGVYYMRGNNDKNQTWSETFIVL